MTKKFFLFIFFINILFVLACASKEEVEEEVVIENPDDISNEDENPSVVYADIDFSNWKVTLPVDENNNGSPDEYKPNELVNGGYRTLKSVQPFMYDDTSDASIVFYTFPQNSTANSKYSRTELRELIAPSNSRINWTLETGGTLKGKLKIMEISKDNSSSSRTYHNTIVMQIHGIISIADMTKHGFSSNNGPPLIKMRWVDGDLWVYRKSLVNESTSGDDLLDVSNATWSDEKYNMGTVGFDAFEFRITASKGKIELQLNNKTPYIYEDISLAKWPFENYFKAGNYLGTTDAGAFSKLKYYNLSVTH
ncbi:polysaccharide lyase family 7 protein [uncultured Polaribacter sp.]|uniref:polysaccharide lyase family 7 protein n=1 Tax=uncultured Polaribacter sp. TaxID=174711 RepID=UPI00261CC4BD|nr:polysaccharide lyase family 7 protein [uncultured Polaribacter sp.]